ncbi:MAG: hypothetical protein ACOYXW_04790 [Actinomycetota bacterium]
MGARAVCDRCGTPVPPGTPDDQAPLGWSFGVERGRTTWICERCTRENARSIEGKLGTDWW